MTLEKLRYYLTCCKPSHLNPRIEVKDLSEINPSFLRDIGIKGLVFDVDNTITRYHGIEPDHKIGPYFRWLTNEFKSCIITNATQERREQVKNSFGIHVINSKVRKPFQEPFNEALIYLNTAPKETAMIGDRLLTDIAGGNIAGITTIKVNSLRRFSQPIHHMTMRALETCLLDFYREEGHAVKTYLPKNYLNH